jgi:hypothetical protein
MKSYTTILFGPTSALPLAMELIAKCNSSIEIGFTNLTFISFENFLWRKFKTLDFNSLVLGLKFSQRM